MAAQSKTVWTPFRRAMGNLLPALFAVPPMALGLLQLVRAGQTFGPGLYWVATGPVLGWVAMNFLGLYQNGAMRRHMLREYRAERGEDELEKVFVGMASPSYSSIVDPHEDVGFLVVHEEGVVGTNQPAPSALWNIEFWGERKKVLLRKDQITAIRFRPNAHTFVGLGGWISIEGVADGKPVRLLIEPREKDTLLGNVRLAKHFKKRLEVWLASSDK